MMIKGALCKNIKSAVVIRCTDVYLLMLPCHTPHLKHRS